MSHQTGGSVEFFKSVSVAQMAIVSGIVTAIAWITLGGTPALVITLVAGGAVALRAVSESDG